VNASLIVTLIAALLGSGIITGLLNWLLNRRHVDKRLNMEETHTDVDVFAEQRRAYEDLLDRSTKAVKAAEDARDEAVKQAQAYSQERGELLRTVQALTAKVESLQNADSKLTRLIRAFQGYVLRVGVSLTNEEWDDVEATIPRSMLRIKRDQQEGIV
jgi:hypothetical protein